MEIGDTRKARLGNGDQRYQKAEIGNGDWRYQKAKIGEWGLKILES